MIEKVFALISNNKIKSFLAFWIVSPVVTIVILLAVFGLFPYLKSEIKAEVQNQIVPIEYIVNHIKEDVKEIKQIQKDIYNHLIKGE